MVEEGRRGDSEEDLRKNGLCESNVSRSGKSRLADG